MERSADVESLIRNLASDSESARKLAAFQLQSQVADPDFVDAFVSEDGLRPLSDLIVEENGNTLAYALGSLNRILELEYGWEQVGIEVPERAVSLVTTSSPPNVLRAAFALLSLIALRPSDTQLDYPLQSPGASPGLNLEALKPILREHTNFLEMLISHLSSADHALRATSLQFLNALVRDSILTFSETQLMRFVQRLQDLEIFSTVETLMRANSLSDDIAAQILDFQTLTKVMLRCWRHVQVDMSRSAHAEALENIRRAAVGPKGLPLPKPLAKGKERATDSPPTTNGASLVPDSEGMTAADPEGAIPWTTLGFSSDSSPVSDFETTGLLGLMDLADFVRKNGAFFARTLLEQSVQTPEARCPVARVGVAVTALLYEYFDVGAASASPRSSTVLQERVHSGDVDAIQPLLLSRDRLHTALCHAFFRLWRESGAVAAEVDKVLALVRLALERVVGEAGRAAAAAEVEGRIEGMGLAELRGMQVREEDVWMDRAWGEDLALLRSRLHSEAVQFMQEQRVRCLLDGAWFPSLTILGSGQEEDDGEGISGWRFVRLSASRRYLHHLSTRRKLETSPATADMPQRIDVNLISSVVSKVASNVVIPEEAKTKGAAQQQKGEKATVTRLTVQGRSKGLGGEETALLELQCVSPATASEWLDGMLMLLDQEPITADTNKLIGMIEDWSLKVRMLDLDWGDVDWERDAGKAVNGDANEGGQQEYSREGLDDDYWYDMGEGE